MYLELNMIIVHSSTLSAQLPKTNCFLVWTRCNLTVFKELRTHNLWVGQCTALHWTHLKVVWHTGKLDKTPVHATIFLTFFSPICVCQHGVHMFTSVGILFSLLCPNPCPPAVPVAHTAGPRNHHETPEDYHRGAGLQTNQCAGLGAQVQLLDYLSSSVVFGDTGQDVDKLTTHTCTNAGVSHHNRM